MSKSVPYLNEIVSLTVMLLLAVALIAGQAGATIHDDTSAQGGLQNAVQVAREKAPFLMTFKAQIDGQPLTISIDAVAEISQFRLEDE